MVGLWGHCVIRPVSEERELYGCTMLYREKKRLRGWASRAFRVQVAGSVELAGGLLVALNLEKCGENKDGLCKVVLFMLKKEKRMWQSSDYQS